MTATAKAAEITFERSVDLPLIRQIISAPSIYPNVTDDGSVPAEEFQPVDPDKVCYVIVRIKGEVAGLWMFAPTNCCTWEVHTCILPWARGRKAIRAAKLLAQWFWENTNIDRVWTSVPQFNASALYFAKVVGMIEFGRHPMSFRKGGKLFDQTLLGMSRPGAV